MKFSEPLLSPVSAYELGVNRHGHLCVNFVNVVLVWLSEFLIL